MTGVQTCALPICLGKALSGFAKTIERLGFENVEAQLLGNELLERRQQILDAELHMTGGATC